MSQVSMQNMFDQWAGTNSKLADVLTRLDQQLTVADNANKTELQAIKNQLLTTLNVKDADTLAKQQAILDALTSGIGVTNWPANQTVTDAAVKAELELLKTETTALKEEMIAVKERLNETLTMQLTGSLLRHQFLNDDRPSANQTYYGQTKATGSLSAVDTVIPLDVSAWETVYIYYQNNCDIITRNDAIYFYDRVEAGSYTFGRRSLVLGNVPVGQTRIIALTEKIDIGLGSDIMQIPKLGARGIVLQTSMGTSGVGTVNVSFLGGKPYVYGGGA